MPEIENVAEENIEVKDNGGKLIPLLIGAAVCTAAGFAAKKLYTVLKKRLGKKSEPEVKTDASDGYIEVEDTAK